MRGSWTKHGDGRKYYTEAVDKWVCQSCASTFTKEFKRHRYKWGEDEIGVCDKCEADECIIIVQRLKRISITL